VVDQLRKEGLSTATFKEYLNGVCLVAQHFGNDRIAAQSMLARELGLRETD